MALSHNFRFGVADLTGRIIFVGGSVAPPGYLKCNGAAISRTAYADLFAAIGTTYGAGDGSTTFNVPETRGEFLRCLDDSRGVDSGRGRGTAQLDAAQDHTHYMIGDGGGLDDIVGQQASNPDSPFSTLGNGTGGRGDAMIYIANMSTGRIAPETRPRNVAFLTCIKF